MNRCACDATAPANAAPLTADAIHAEVDRAIALHGTRPEAAIPILQELQARLRHLPREALERVCSLTDITPAQATGVSTFYTQFRHRGLGRHLIQVCHGTACHVAGAPQITAALRRHLKIPADPGGEADPDALPLDTSPDGLFTIERVACLGCCTLAPVMLIDGIPYGHLNPVRAAAAVEQFLHDEASGRHARQRRLTAAGEPTGGKADGGGNAGGVIQSPPEGDARPAPGGVELRIGLNSCCIANGSLEVYERLCREAAASGARVTVKPVGCIGMCHRVPIVEVVTAGGRSTYYGGNDPRSAAAIVRERIRPRGLWPRARRALDGFLEWSLNGRDGGSAGGHAGGRRALLEARRIDPQTGAGGAFLARQVHIATEHCGRLDPLDIDEYLATGGYVALRRAREAMTPEEVIAAIERSGLRGRGGGGFPAGLKWARARQAPGGRKFVVCNGDEGDPGAFMDRMMLEAYPHRIVEGLAIAARAVGAAEGYFYIRAEYALAIERIRAAIAQAEARGLLGDPAAGGLRLRIMRGAGAFVCGEETALIASLEGERGMPRLRPPYPAERGLWGCPTCVNNVETLACVPWILREGPEAFAALGTAQSRGTKVFALAGKVARGGLVEVPMGMTIGEVVEQIGGGVKGAARGRVFKAVQIGGPSGGCIPAGLAATPIDFEAVAATGAIMGSGGLVVMDDRTCMVDMARFFLDFTQKESCGKCTFCRIGTKRMLEILERLCAGQGRARDLDDLEELALQVKRASLCGLGKTAPNPVLTTLKYFREEYEAHVAGRCPAGRCAALVSYRVTEACIGCTICAQECPVGAIPAAPYRRHAIDDARCVRCDACLAACPERAIEVVPRSGAQS